MTEQTPNQTELLPLKMSKTYEETAIEWLGGLYEQLKDVPEAHHLFTEAESETDIVIEPLEIVREGVIRFSHYLDRGNHVDIQMELLALRQISKIDREFMSEMIDELGLDKAKEIAQRVENRRIRLSQQSIPELDAIKQPIS
jgi:hypothetical protein